MKKILNLICAIVLGSIMCSSFASCSKTGDEPKPEYLAVCITFVRTTPNEEMVLLCKSENGYYNTPEELEHILADFETEYGKGNVVWTLQYLIRSNPESLPDCYEITVAASIKDSWLGNMVDKDDGGIHINKFYHWAFNDRDIDKVISHFVDSYNERGYSDKIISITNKNLGPEVHNMPIEF